MHFSHSICLRPARGRSVYTRWQGGNLETCWNYRFSLPQHLTHFCSHSSWCFTYMTRRLPGFYSFLSVLVKPFGWKYFDHFVPGIRPFDQSWNGILVARGYCKLHQYWQRTLNLRLEMDATSTGRCWLCVCADLLSHDSVSVDISVVCRSKNQSSHWDLRL